MQIYCITILVANTIQNKAHRSELLSIRHLNINTRSNQWVSTPRATIACAQSGYLPIFVPSLIAEQAACDVVSIALKTQYSLLYLD